MAVCDSTLAQPKAISHALFWATPQNDGSLPIAWWCDMSGWICYVEEERDGPRMHEEVAHHRFAPLPDIRTNCISGKVGLIELVVASKH